MCRIFWIWSTALQTCSEADTEADKEADNEADTEADKEADKEAEYAEIIDINLNEIKEPIL